MRTLIMCINYVCLLIKSRALFRINIVCARVMSLASIGYIMNRTDFLADQKLLCVKIQG